MALRDWIVESGKAATVTVATLATVPPPNPSSVAVVATVAVASSQDVKTEGADLDTLLAEACQYVEGIDAATFRALLSPVDVEDIEGGHIPVHALRAYARSFAEGIRTGRIAVLAATAPQAPRTSRVRCADCQHFERDTIGDGTGIGRCKIGGEGTGAGHPALWADAERECKDFKSREGAAGAEALDPIEVRLLGADAIML